MMIKSPDFQGFFSFLASVDLIAEYRLIQSSTQWKPSS